MGKEGARRLWRATNVGVYAEHPRDAGVRVTEPHVQTPRLSGPVPIDGTRIEQSNPMIAGTKFLRDGLGAIRGSAVDNQNLCHLFGLRNETFETSFDSRCFVDNGQYNAHALRRRRSGSLDFIAAGRFQQPRHDADR